MAAVEVEETIRRLSSHKGVEGIIISTYEGVALKSTVSKELTTKYAGLMSQLVLKARGAVRTIDAEVCAKPSPYFLCVAWHLGKSTTWLSLTLSSPPLNPPLLFRMTLSFSARAPRSTK